MSIGQKVREYRELMGLSQVELAEASGLSYRTIQRVESGKGTPRGHSLKVLANVFDVSISDFKEAHSKTNDSLNFKVRTINASVLAVIAVPFGNLIFPIYFWRKYRVDNQIDLAGRSIINFQILWSIVTYLSLIIIPFLSHSIGLKTSGILTLWILAVLINIAMVFKMSKRLALGKTDIYKFGLRLI